MESSDTNKGSRTRSDENHIQQHNMFETEHSESVSYRVDNGDPAINSDTPSWPNFERFPYNRSKKHGGLKQASELVAKDLRKANNILIITGFTSMSYLISFFSECWERGDCKESLRLVIGYDYVFRKQKTSSIGRNIRIGEEAADEAIRSHLLRQRYSVYQCLQVVNTKHLLAMDHVQVRTSPDSKHHVHAKIYKTDEIITFGSSNFSPQGLGELIEVNARTKRPDARFVDISRYAEQIWQICRDYKKTLQDLLDKLMREVTWQEALARSCAELLEGAWAKRYIEDSLRGDSLSLWPFQIQGIAEALYIIENIGGVLVADATGSGKTRLGSMLIKSLTHKMLSDPAQMRNMTPVLLSPPKVYGRWKRTIGDCGFGVSIFSHGAMSNPQSKEHKGLIRALRRAQVIVVDEAHNFLNRNSQRSQVLMHNFADHILLFTATPINRDPGDLFRIVTLLGPDNFDDALVNSLVSILGSRRRKRAVKNQDLATGKRDILQDVVRQFTLRRTKKIINQIVESDQDNHLDDSGRICRYPEHLPKTYSCLGTQQDQEIAHKIYQESQQLKGLIWLRTTLQQPPYSDKTDQQYLDQRLRGAQGLASYMIMNALRSSRAALIEHIFGTIEALKQAGLPGTSKSKSTGSVVSTLQNIAGSIPENKLSDVVLPDWLRLPDEHRDQCIADLDCYKRIGELAKQISTAREQSKAKHLVSLFQSHRYILAFDRHLITLAYIASLIPEAAHREIIVVTGDTSKQARRLQYLLDPDMQGELNSKETAPAEIIGLCSDVLSEGVNLQKASAIVHLDMPTVVVRAEQRLGRSDRINSPHERIESWWPVDGAAFAPRGDEKLFDRLFIVGDVLGANIELPVGLFSNRDDTVTPEIMFQEIRDEEIRREQEAAEDDVFAPIRALIAGEQSIIPENVYTHIRKQPEKIQTSVSIVQSTQAWAFLTVAGENGSPPRMVFFEDIEANPITRLDKVASVLRQRLGPDTENRIFDGDAQDYLSKFADRLSQVERQLLPKRKQRALSEMQIVLTHHVKKASTSQLSEEQTTESSSARIHELMSILLDMLSGKPQKIQRENNERLSPNFNTLSDRWLDLSRPFIQERSEKLKQRRRFVRLKDIRDDLKNTNFSISIIEHLLNPELLWSSPVDERVVAAIIGIPLT